MATNCSAGTFSYPPKIADFFHSFAHLNFDFHNVSSVFVPTLEDYQQVLFLYAVVPCLFGGLVFLIFCVHFIASWCSCDKQHRPGQKCVSTLRCIVLLVSVLSSGLIIAAFVFNDSADQGVKGVLTAINNVNNTLVEIQSKINLIKDDLVDLDSNIIDVKSCTNVTVVQELIDKLRVHIGNIVTTVVKIKKVDLPPIEEYVQDTESHRWWITFGTLCLNTLSCLVLIYAVLRGSRCGFVLAVILGTFSLLLVWPSVGIDLALAVGMSDLCVNPKGTVYYYIKDQPSLRNTGVVSYYMECPTGKHNPFHKYADKAQRSVEKALTVFLTLMNLGLHLPQDCQDKLSSCQSDLTQTQTSMSVITKNLDCTYAHEQFKSANCFLCDGVVVGIAELLLVTLIIGVLVIIHLSLVLPIYLRIRKHRKRQSILDMCGLDSPIGTPYQSISEDDNRAETVSLIASAPLPSTYNSINHRSSMEFHSFEESGITGHYNHGATEPLIPQSHSTSSLTVNPAPSNPSIPSTRGQITSMAF